MGFTCEELKPTKKKSIVLEKQENIKTQQNSKGFYQTKSSAVKEKFYTPVEKKNKNFQKKRSKNKFSEDFQHSLILENQQQQEFLEKIHHTAEQLTDLAESINHEIENLQPRHSRLLERNNKMERKKCKKEETTWANHLGGNNSKANSLKQSELKQECVCTYPQYVDDKHLLARPQMRSIASQSGVVNNEFSDEGAVGDHNCAFHLKENKSKNVKNLKEELMISDLKGAIPHDRIVNCCYGLKGQPQCCHSNLAKACHHHNYQRAAAAGNREYNYCCDEYYFDCGNCNCNTQRETRNTAAENSKFRRQSTDLNTQHFYCRPEERTTSPEPRSNSKSKKKSKSYKSKQSYDEYNESKKRECEERLEKLKERSCKRQCNKSTDAFYEKANKQYIDDQEKEFTFKSNKVSKASQISKDFLTSTTVKIRSESKFCQVTVRKKHIDPKNKVAQDLHEYNDVSQDTQYPLETLRMLKKMTISEYKAVKPQDRQEDIIKKEQDLNTERENKRLEKVRRYQEYLNKYKREQEAKNSIQILKRPPLVFPKQVSEEAKFLNNKKEQRRDLGNPTGQIETFKDNQENILEQLRVEVPEIDSSYSVQTIASYNESIYNFEPIKRVMGTWDESDNYREEELLRFKDKYAEEHRRRPATIKDNSDAYRAPRHTSLTNTEYKREDYKERKRPELSQIRYSEDKRRDSVEKIHQIKHLNEREEDPRSSYFENKTHTVDGRKHSTDSLSKRDLSDDEDKKTEFSDERIYSHHNKNHAAKRTNSEEKGARSTDNNTEIYRNPEAREQQSGTKGQPMVHQTKYRELSSGQEFKSKFKTEPNETQQNGEEEQQKQRQYLDEVGSDLAKEFDKEDLYASQTYKRHKRSTTDSFQYELEEGGHSPRSSFLKDLEDNVEEKNKESSKIYEDKADKKVEGVPPTQSLFEKEKPKDQAAFQNSHISNSSLNKDFEQVVDQNLELRTNVFSQTDHDLQFRTNRSSQTEYNFLQDTAIEPKATQVLSKEEKTPKNISHQNEFDEEIREVTQQHEINMDNTSLVPQTTTESLKYLNRFLKICQQSELDGEILNSLPEAAYGFIIKLSSCKSLPQIERISDIDLQQRKSFKENSVQTLETKLMQDTQFKYPETKPNSNEAQLTQQINDKESMFPAPKTPTIEFKSSIVVQPQELKVSDEENKFLQQETYCFKSQIDFEHRKNSQTYQKYVECEGNVINSTKPQPFKDDQNSLISYKFASTTLLPENQTFLCQDLNLPLDYDPQYCEPCVESHLYDRPGRSAAFGPALVPLKSILKPCRLAQNSEQVCQDLDSQRTTSVVSFGHNDNINTQTDSAMSNIKGQKEIAQQYHETRDTIITKDKQSLSSLERNSKYMLTESSTTRRPIYQDCQSECDSLMEPYTADSIPHLYTVEMPVFEQCPCMWDIYREMLTNYYKARHK